MKEYEVELNNNQDIKKQDKQNIKDNEWAFEVVAAKLKDNKNLTFEEVNVLDTNLEIMNNSRELTIKENEINKKFVDSDNPDFDKNREIFFNVSFSCDRGPSISSDFIIWMMGSKDLSVRDAIRILTSDNVEIYIKEFVDFCKDNALLGVKPDKAKEGAKKWAKVMKTATDKMKEYTFPDIDYNNPSAEKEYLFELDIICQLTVNFVQDYSMKLGETRIDAGIGEDKKSYGKKMANEYLAEDLGGLDGLKSIESFWKNIQLPFKMFSDSHNISEYMNGWDEGNSDEIKKGLLNAAFNDFLFKKTINMFKGKKLKEISYKDIKSINLYHSNSFTIKGDILSGKVALNPDFLIDYVTGRNSKPFEDFIDGYITPRVEKEMELADGVAQGKGFLTAGSIPKKFADDIMAVGDKAEDMETFIDEPDYEGKSHTILLYERWDNTLGRNAASLAQALGIDSVNLIKIDGKTPEELWGKKYKNIKDISRKQLLYRAEIIKAAIAGDKELSIATAYVSKGRLVRGNDAKFLTKRSDIREMSEGYSLSEKYISTVFQKLKGFYTRLSEVQSNPENNFTSNNTEGSMPYQKMCRNLANCLWHLSHKSMDDFNLLILKEALENLNEASGAYYKRGKTSNQVKLEVAKEISDELPVMINVLGYIIKMLDKGIVFDGKGKSIIENSYTSMGNNIKSLSELSSEFDAVVKLSHDEVDTRFNELNEVNKARLEFDKLVQSSIGKLPAKNKKLSTKEAAKLVVYKSYIEGTKTKNITADEILERKDAFDKVYFNAWVDELSENKVFKVIAEKYQHKAFEKWKSVLDRANLINDRCNRLVDKYEGNKAINYIYGNEKGFVLTGEKDHKFKDKYERLGEIVANKIITAPHNVNLLQGLAAGQFEMSDLTKACTDYFRKGNVLDGGDALGRNMFTPDILRAKLEDTTFIMETLKNVAVPLKKAQENQAKKAKTTKAAPKNVVVNVPMK